MAPETTKIVTFILLVLVGELVSQRGPGGRGAPGPPGPRGPRGRGPSGPGSRQKPWSQPPPVEYRLITKEMLDGVGAAQGRVEGRLNSTAPWRPLCSYRWYNNEAGILCRTLGFLNGSAVTQSVFPVNETLLDPDVIKINYMCKGNESSLADCPGQWLTYCSRSSSVAVICNDDKTDIDGFEDVRLHGRYNSTALWAAGRVEVFHRGIWGNICTYRSGWTVTEATATCRRLGYRFGYPVGTPSSLGNSNYALPFWLGNLSCRTDAKKPTGAPPGGIQEDADAEFVRPRLAEPMTDDLTDLVKLEECRNDGWGFHHRYCNHYSNDAAVVCNNLSKRLQDSQMTGIRLVNKTSGPEDDWVIGRLQVQVEGTWGLVCESRQYGRQIWGSMDARVACKQLGYMDGLPASASLFGASDDIVWLNGKRCTGNEETLNDCGPTGLPEVVDCRVGGAGVVCSRRPFVHEKPDITNVVRLSPIHTKAKAKAGQVEVHYKGQWGPICDNNWDVRDATVVCKILGYEQGQPMKNSAFEAGQGIPWMDNVGCSGSETNMARCTRRRGDVYNSACNGPRFAGVICSDCDENEPVTVRLSGTSSQSSGLVEVFYKGQWGTICSKNWDDEDAKVVCKELGFSGGFAMKTPNNGTGMVWLTNVQCTGTESSIKDCKDNVWGSNSMHLPCNHTEDAGVICHGMQAEESAEAPLPPEALFAEDPQNNIENAASQNARKAFAFSGLLTIIIAYILT